MLQVNRLKSKIFVNLLHVQPIRKSIEELPPEILDIIASYLPITSIIRFRLTNKYIYNSLNEFKYMSFLQKGYISFYLDKRTGLKEYLMKRFFENGHIHTSCYFDEGLKHGNYIEYSKNNYVKFIMKYKHGIPHGEFKEYYDNHNLKCKAKFSKGKPNGHYKEYNHNGFLIHYKYAINNYLIISFYTPHYILDKYHIK